MLRVRFVKAVVHVRTTDFKVLPWAGHDDQTFGVIQVGIIVLENQERWQVGDDAVYTLQH